jgi:serine/threonine-protein kinase
LGGFDLICKIGQGGMGSVFKARQVSLDRIVALKILPPSIAQNNPVFIERFIREARTSAKLNHPNVVQGIEVGQDEATKLYYFAMEYVDGPTAKVLIKQQQRLPEVRSLEIAYGVAQALVCAQRAGIVHRDIKPDNILLTSKGDVKLADLGLARGNFDASLDTQDTGSAKSNRASTTHVDLTQSGSTIGTPSYMAPEQVRGEIDRLDVRTDLYALGATLYYMLTGMPPYVARTAAAIMNMHLNEPVPDVRVVNPDVSEGAAALIARLMQKDPKDRYQTAEELVTDLQALLRGEPLTSPTTKRTSAPMDGAAASGRTSTERPGRRTITFAVAAFVAICAIVALLLWIRAKPEPQKQAEAPVPIPIPSGNTPNPDAPAKKTAAPDAIVAAPSTNKEAPAQPAEHGDRSKTGHARDTT